jgi:paired small multidrug resistance pump
MNSDWIRVVIASFFEVGWVIGLKYAYNFWTWAGTLISIFICFYVLIIAGRKLPVGTVYAVFVGLGTAGTVLSGALFFGETLHVAKVILICILLIGVMGLKMVTHTKKTERTES